MSGSGAPAISLRSVSKRYGDGIVLDAVSLDVREGEFLTLLGPSGSGKTTILNIIAGFIAPDSGTLHFGAQDMTSVPPHLRGIGVVFQSYALFPHMTVADNVAFPLRARKVAGPELDARVEWALSLVKLGGFGGRRIDQLSGGQKQRVALARAIVFKPKLILMDEPLSALDKQLREQMQIEIRALHEQLGATTVYVTHDQREALTMSHRIAVLNHGRIAQLDTPETIYDKPVDAFVADFIGEAVLAPVFKTGSHTVSLKGHALRSSNAIPDGQSLVLVIRSEKLRIASPDQGTNAFPARVKERVFQGESMLFLLELEGGTICTFRQPTHVENAAQMPSPGAAVTLSLHPDHTVIVPVERHR